MAMLCSAIAAFYVLIVVILMKKINLILILLVFSINLCFAYTSYDPNTGNSYNVNRNPDGGAQVYGNNFNTGSTWNTNINRNGDMNGYDSGGNYWTYNNSSGSYYNYGTGQSCNGKGYYRSCS